MTKCIIKQKLGRTPGDRPRLEVEKEPGVLKLVEDSTYTRILGANVQGNMLWHAHMEIGEKALLPQVRKQMGMLRCLGRQIPLSSNLARGLILSRLTYFMPLWGGASETLIRQTQVVFNTAARWATGMGEMTRIT